MASSFGVIADVFEHTQVDTLDPQIGPKRPVRVRVHVELVPRVSDQSCTSVGKFLQYEFATRAAQGSVEVWRGHVPVGREFEHRSWLLFRRQRPATAARPGP